ncbi:WD repeat-containing protein [Myxozyma melibiosi]|uniref:WD repeat-containing protein n=1 Tax=Myxozyma melibiosi TaxID=54550 RepID=A0ABR1FC17_9ASCO
MHQSDDDDELRKFLPSGFGKQTAAPHDFESRYEKCLRADYKARQEKKKQEDAEDSDDDDDDSDDDELEELPISHELLLKEHTKTISALDIDPAGVRLASGGYDFDLDLWDFNGMNPAFQKPFRTLEPVESHLIRDLQFSRTGDYLLVVPSASQAKVYTRDGVEVSEFVRGDMYIRDMNNTSGHIAELTCGRWHPTDTTTFATSSLDSTVRIWDMNVKRSQTHVIILKPKSVKHAKPHISAISWKADDGKYIAAAANDGSISYWSANGPYSRPVASIAEAHEPGSWTSGLEYASDGTTIVSRGGDGTVKLWDTRSFKKPVLSRGGLANLVPETGVGFSPDERYIITGTSTTPESPVGKLHILDRSDLSTVTALGFSDEPSSVVKAVWHPRLNQIVVGTSTGAMHVLFSREKSTKGAKLVLEKAPKVRHVDDDVTADIDLVAASTSMSGGGGGQQRKKKSNAEAMKPEIPLGRKMHGEMGVIGEFEDEEEKMNKRRRYL